MLCPQFCDRFSQQHEAKPWSPPFLPTSEVAAEAKTEELPLPNVAPAEAAEAEVEAAKAAGWGV